MGVLLLLQGMLAGWNPWAFGALVTGATLSLSLIGWFGIERPVMRRARSGGRSS